MRLKLDTMSPPLHALAKAAEGWIIEGNRPRHVTVNPITWENMRYELVSLLGKHGPQSGGFDLHSETFEPGDAVKIRLALCGFIVALAADPAIPRDEAEFT